MARNDLYVHGATFCSHGCLSGQCCTQCTSRHQSKKPTLGNVSLSLSWCCRDNLGGWLLTCMMELAGIDWRGALVWGEQACHTPCPCHASQPHSSHTDANQARLPWKEVPEKCQQTPEKEATSCVSHIRHNQQSCMLNSRLARGWGSAPKNATPAVDTALV